MSVIYQPTPFSCMACVVAMITGESLATVFEDLGHDGSRQPFKFLECAAYLNQRGFHLGADGKAFGLCRIPYTQPALVVVERSSGAGNHAVLWDGSRVLDPEPANVGRTLWNYKIREWWPVSRYEG